MTREELLAEVSEKINLDYSFAWEIAGVLAKNEKLRRINYLQLIKSCSPVELLEIVTQCFVENQSRNDDLRQRAVDMETVIAALACRKYNGVNDLIKEKLGKWKDHTAMRWDWLLDRLGP